MLCNYRKRHLVYKTVMKWIKVEHYLLRKEFDLLIWISHWSFCYARSIQAQILVPDWCFSILIFCCYFLMLSKLWQTFWTQLVSWLDWLEFLLCLLLHWRWHFVFWMVLAHIQHQIRPRQVPPLHPRIQVLHENRNQNHFDFHQPVKIR